MISFKDFINEEEKTVGVFLGRFQPVTKAHSDIIKKMSKENDTSILYLVKGKITSKNKEQNPFDEEIQIKMLKKVAPKNVQIKVIPTGFFIDDINERPEKSFVVYAGSDREKQYIKFFSYIEEDKKIRIEHIKRSDEDISATKLRTALKDDNEKEFKKLAPAEIHSMYEELKNEI
jgi:cytidyltransferase-like protein